MKNIFKGKEKKEIQSKLEVKQRSGNTDIDNIIDKNEAEKINTIKLLRQKLTSSCEKVVTLRMKNTRVNKNRK